MSGHSKWATIKRKKGAADAKRGKIFSKVVKEITVAARLGGGDPTGNPRLRRALDLARTTSMPAENIARAIKKGTGELEGTMYEELVYEGVGPGGVLFLADVVTDNRNRTAPELRKLLDKHGGQLGAAGSAAWAFDQFGIITLARAAATEEQLFEIAVGAGAEDVGKDDETWTVTTPRELLDSVRDALETAGIELSETGLQYIPKTQKLLDGDDARKMLAILESLDDHDDVGAVASEADFTDEALEAAG